MRIKRLLQPSLFLVVSSWIAAASLGASTIIFSNLVGDCCGGYGVGGSTAEGGPETFAAAFTPSANYLMTDAQVGVSTEGDGSFNASLYSDDGPFPAGLVATFGIGLEAPRLGGIVDASGASVPLIAGVQYWLVLSPFDTNSFVDWEGGGSLRVPSNALVPPGTWFPIAVSRDIQFQIDGAAIPEPANWMWGAAALALIASARRRGKMCEKPFE